MASDDAGKAEVPSGSLKDLTALVRELAARVDQIEKTVVGLQQVLLSKSNPVGRGIASTTAPLREETSVAPPPLPERLPVPAVVPGLKNLDETAVTGLSAAKPASFEDRLGAQIFNRIAIVAILIGAALGLKLAIDNHLIGPLGRILVGLVSGAGMVVWSERFRRREFAAFSYSLKAIGSGILYLSLWAAFQLYHLLPAEAAFGLMLLVTAWNAWMAWTQESELLAAYAITGAFATPALISTGGNHQVFLFSYLLSIDAATLCLVWFEGARDARRPSAQLRAESKPWSRLLVAALAATVTYFIGWFSSYYTAGQLASTGLFVGLFFLAFLTAPLLLPVRDPTLSGGETGTQRFGTVIGDVFLPLANACFGFMAFYSVLEDADDHAALSWMALLLAAVYLGVMRLRQSATARAIHLSLAVALVTLAIPLKTSGRWLTLGWLAEGVSLLLASARLDGSSGSMRAGQLIRQAEDAARISLLVRRLGAAALTLGFAGLLTTPYRLDRTATTAFVNQRFATELAGILALGSVIWICVRADSSRRRVLAGSQEPFAAPGESFLFPEWIQLSGGATVALNLVALLAGVREIQTFWLGGGFAAALQERGPQAGLSISGFFMLYGAALLTIGFRKRSYFLRLQALILLIAAIGKVFLYDVRSLSQGYRVVSFLGLGVLLLSVSYFYVRRDRATDKS